MSIKDILSPKQDKQARKFLNIDEKLYQKRLKILLQQKAVKNT